MICVEHGNIRLPVFTCFASDILRVVNNAASRTTALGVFIGLQAEQAECLGADAVDGRRAEAPRHRAHAQGDYRGPSRLPPSRGVLVILPTFDVTAYRTLWFGLQYDSESADQGETVGTARSRRCAGTTVSRSATGICRDSSRPSKTSSAICLTRRLHAVDGETVPETEAGRASWRPTGAAHSDQRVALREGEPEPLLD